MKVAIIGAGLTGLLTAVYLKQNNIDSIIIEARDRLGGRIDTIKDDETQVEMGATWFASHHQNLIELLQMLNISTFPQFQDGKAVFEASSMAPVQVFDLPKGQQTSFRIEGGTLSLIDKLIGFLSSDQVILNSPVTGISVGDKGATIETSKETYHSIDLVISTLPPALLVNSVSCIPEISDEIKQLSKETHTWMGDSIKFAVTYSSPFWRNQGFAGVGFSNSSIASEIHDHVNSENSKFALKGFLSPGAVKLDFEYRKKLVINQLKRFFGSEAGNIIAYHETTWINELFTMGGLSNDLVPHQNNGNQGFQKIQLNGKMLISGSETSPVNSGYMDGAVYAAKLAAQWVIDHLE